jgi:uncharacterized protein (DUF2267 family)
VSIDAVAVLRIANLVPPRTWFGTTHHVEYRGDATLFHMFDGFDAFDPDEHALGLRRRLGAALDAHDDERGILFFPDICEPKGTSYEAIVREVASAGRWTPKVDEDYLPQRWRGSPRYPLDALVGQLTAVVGREAAWKLEFDVLSKRMDLAGAPDRADAQAAFGASLDAIARIMGAEFAASWEATLNAQLEALQAAQRRQEQELDELLPGRERAAAPPSEHDALLEEMSAVMGHDTATKHNIVAAAGRIAVLSAPDDAAASARYTAAIAPIARAMGAAFTERYEASLRQVVDADFDQLATQLKDWVPPPSWL